MPSNNSKYSEEMRTQTAEHILRSGKSATSVAEELGIDTKADDSNIQCPGLFGGLCGLVRNLNVNASISGNSDNWSGIGGIAGVLSYYFRSCGMVQNCNANVTQM